jgi:hypothetical protein
LEIVGTKSRFATLEEAVAQLASVDVVMYTRAGRYVCKE